MLRSLLDEELDVHRQRLLHQGDVLAAMLKTCGAER